MPKLMMMLLCLLMQAFNMLSCLSRMSWSEFIAVPATAWVYHSLLHTGLFYALSLCCNPGLLHTIKHHPALSAHGHLSAACLSGAIGLLQCRP